MKVGRVLFSRNTLEIVVSGTVFLSTVSVPHQPRSQDFLNGVTSMSNVYVCVYKQTSRQD